MVGRVDAETDDIAGYPEGPDPVRPEAVLLQDAVQTIPGLPAGARTVRCRACGGGGDIARAIGGRLLPRRTRGVPEKPVDAQGEEAVPPAPDRRLRHARPPNGPGRPAARTRFRDDAGPPDVLPEAPRVARDPFEACAVRVRKQDLLPIGLSPA